MEFSALSPLGPPILHPQQVLRGACLLLLFSGCSPGVPLTGGSLTPPQISNSPPGPQRRGVSPPALCGMLALAGLNPAAPPSLPTNDSPRDGTMAKNRVCHSWALLGKAATTQGFSASAGPWGSRPGALGPLPELHQAGWLRASTSLALFWPKWRARGGAKGNLLLQKSL